MKTVTRQEWYEIDNMYSQKQVMYDKRLYTVTIDVSNQYHTMSIVNQVFHCCVWTFFSTAPKQMCYKR